jgi:excinuclease ABC subunit A
MGSDGILIAGARTHNLRNITVTVPRNTLTVVTGLSGSGKSSLAFDTLYAEGQRRYVESLSAYARQFLDQLQKPDVDHIEGLSPAIAIEQRTAGNNPRSIVATATEIHDYLRLLFAHIGHRHCPKCKRPVTRQSAQEIARRIRLHPEGTRVMIAAPLARGKADVVESAMEAARSQGFVRLRLDGDLYEAEDTPKLSARRNHVLEAIVDRLVMGADVGARLSDSIELALKTGSGIMKALRQPTADAPWAEELFADINLCPHCETGFEELAARHFSFNSPYGACPACSGIGTVPVFDEALIVPRPELSLADGAIHAWRKGGRRLMIYYRQWLRALAKHYEFSLDTPFGELPEKIRKILFHGSGEEEIETGYWRGGAFRRQKKEFEGILPNLERRMVESKSELVRNCLKAYMNRQDCPACHGDRLRPESMACTLDGRSIMDVCRMPVREAGRFFAGLPLTDNERQRAGEALKEVRRRLDFLAHVGLDYLTLDRPSGTLSGGEIQRIRLATQIGSGLVGVLYVLDEPTVGLHARDTERLVKILRDLRDLGNTVVVVEHDEQVIRAADHIIELGPGAGRNGGKLIYTGSVEGLMKSADSVTGPYLRHHSLHHARPAWRREPDGRKLRIVGASENNLKNIDVDLPLGVLVCVTGVSGSGKSTLVDDVLRRALFRHFYKSKERPGRHQRILGMEALEKVVVIDQEPIGRTPRSNPATYTGAFDDIRKLFAATPAARVRGYKQNRFSFNVKGGRCEHCKGDGVLQLEMHFLPDVFMMCEECRGLRYNEETLAVRYHGRSIADVLAMTVDEALEFFRNIPAVERKLRTLSEVGLDYLQLGQSATTLSGGEAQRIKLSAELSRRQSGRTLYLLDEPTTGLHFADTERLVGVLLRLRDAGNSVVVIEHNPDVIAAADYLVDLGPEGGEDGGRVVAAGTPEAVAACAASHTGRFLKAMLGVTQGNA